MKRRPPAAPGPRKGHRELAEPSGSGCPFDSRDGQKSIVGIFGPPFAVGLVTGALTRHRRVVSQTGRTRAGHRVLARKSMSTAGEGTRRMGARAVEPWGHSRGCMARRYASVWRRSMERVSLMAECRLNRGTGWELGSRRSEDARGCASSRRRPKLPSETHRTRDGGACGSDERHERSGSTERGSTSHEARGVGIGARERDRKVASSDMRHRSQRRESLPGTMHRCGFRPKRARFTARHLMTGPPARTALGRVEPLYETTELPHLAPPKKRMT